MRVRAWLGGGVSGRSRDWGRFGRLREGAYAATMAIGSGQATTTGP
jgi:hypothetical protein